MKLPKIVSFDAFNTIFTPRKPVLQIYAEVAQRHGLKVPQEHLEERFPIVFKQMQEQYPNYGGHSKMNYVNWWATLISNTYAPHDTPKAFVEEVVDTFSTDDAYGAYADVRQALDQLHRSSEVVMVISSNGDPRVVQVLKALDLLQYFQKVYLSYDLGVSKPSRDFFNHVIDDLRGPFTPREEMLKNAWHVGDELTIDLNASVNAGWNGILVDRDGAFRNLADKQGNVTEQDAPVAPTDPEVIKLDDKRTVISDFSVLGNALGL